MKGKRNLPSDEKYQCKCLKLLHEGGGGKLYKARSLHPNYLGELVVLKIPHPNSNKDRFRYEIRLLKTISHEHVLKVLWPEPPKQFYVTPYIPDKDLVNWMWKNRRKVNIITALDFLIQICDGCIAIFEQTKSKEDLEVQALRDLKPQNLLVNKNKSILICDLGTTKTRYRQMTIGVADEIGTYGWSAPECVGPNAKASTATEKADSYSIARITAWLIIYPFLEKKVKLNKDKGDKWANEYNNFTQIQEVWKKVCRKHEILRAELENLLEIIKPALSKDPDKRPTIEKLKKSFQESFRKIESTIYEKKREPIWQRVTAFARYELPRLVDAPWKILVTSGIVLGFVFLPLIIKIVKVNWTVNPSGFGKVTDQRKKNTVHPEVQNTPPPDNTNTISAVDNPGSSGKEGTTISGQSESDRKNDDGHDTELPGNKKPNYSTGGREKNEKEQGTDGSVNQQEASQPQSPSLYIAISDVPSGDLLTVEWKTNVHVTWEGDPTKHGKAIQQEGVFKIPNCSSISIGVIWAQKNGDRMVSGWFQPSNIKQKLGDAQRNPLSIYKVF